MADLTGMMQAAAGAAGGDNLFIEDVFSCFLYTGNTPSTQTITNGIDLDGEGGLVWIKDRTFSSNHALFGTATGVNQRQGSNTTNALTATANSLTTFNSTGFSVGTSSAANAASTNYVSWTFRKAPKFFDVVTYTGTGANRTVAHNLGSVPGSIWVKRTDTTGDWQVYHRANTAAPETDFLVLNDTAATVDSNTRWNDTLPTDTVFTVGTEATVNASAATYVAYLFAHDDGGFGDDGTENVISCGSFTTNGSGSATVNLGYEPQWVMIKRTDSTSGWIMFDVMREMSLINSRTLQANTSGAEVDNVASILQPTATGFFVPNSQLPNSSTWVYIAIRRGPMKTPTAGTEVFNIDTQGSSAGKPNFKSGFPVDFAFVKETGVSSSLNSSRLTSTGTMFFNNTNAETADSERKFDYQNGWGDSTSVDATRFSWMFRRAPGFFDVVCYTGTGSSTTFAHNLGVVPELMIMKKRSATDDWAVYAGDNTDFLLLNTTAATADNNTYWNDTSPTSTVFSVGTNADVNTSAATYVAYLFASLAGVSDIGTYTGNGTSLTVTTGFQPRFILVKRTDSTGNWIYGDSVRGLVAGNDPFLLLNSNAAQTTDQDWVDVSATGFTVNETGANANVSTGVYFYWAIS